MTHHLLNNFKNSAVLFHLENKIEYQQQLFHEILQVLLERFVFSFLGVGPSLVALKLFLSWLLKEHLSRERREKISILFLRLER